MSIYHEQRKTKFIFDFNMWNIELNNFIKIKEKKNE